MLLFYYTVHTRIHKFNTNNLFKYYAEPQETQREHPLKLSLLTLIRIK